MTAAVHAFTFRRKDTPSLGVFLDGQNIESLEIVRLPRAGQVVSWTIGWPSGAVTKTSAANGGLVLDRRNGAIYWPIVSADLDAIPAGTLVPYAIQIIEADGHATTYLVGTLTVQE